MQTSPNAEAVAVEDAAATLRNTQLRYFNLYRLLMTSVLVAFVLIYPDQIIFGNYSEGLFSRTALAYWAFAVIVMLGADRILRGMHARLTLGVLFDIVFLTLLTYASGGASSGLPFMHVVVLAFAALVGQGHLAVFYAAMASLAMLFEQSMQIITTSGSATSFVQAPNTRAWRGCSPPARSRGQWPWSVRYRGHGPMGRTMCSPASTLWRS